MLKNFRYFMLLFFFCTSFGYPSAKFDEPTLSPRSLKLRRPQNALGLTLELTASLVLSGENGSATEIPNHGTYKLFNPKTDINILTDFLMTTAAQDIVIVQKENEADRITLEIYKWDPEQNENSDHFTFTICKVLNAKLGKKIK